MIEAIQEALRVEGLDGWLFYDHHRRDPLAYRILSLPPDLSPTRRWYYYVPAVGEPKRLLHRIEPRSLEVLEGEPHYYSRWTEQVDMLRLLLAGATRIAMQHSPNCAIPYVAMVDGGTVDLIRSLGIQVVSSADLVQLFEARWSQDQLDMHMTAGQIVDEVRRAAFQRIGSELKAGRHSDEWAICQFILDQFRARGLITDHGPNVSVNENAADPHYEPNPDRHSSIQLGDFVLIDLWAKLDRPRAVYYDITWTGYCGDSPSPEMENIFYIVSGARDAAVTLVQDSAKCGTNLFGFEVDDAARSYISERGYADHFFHRTGHSIGEDVHGAGANMDNFETHDERRVVAGTCFSVEPGIYLPSFGVRSEVNVYVEEASARVTGEIQRRLVRITG